MQHPALMCGDNRYPIAINISKLLLILNAFVEVGKAFLVLAEVLKRSQSRTGGLLGSLRIARTLLGKSRGLLLRGGAVILLGLYPLLQNAVLAAKFFNFVECRLACLGKLGLAGA